MATCEAPLVSGKRKGEPCGKLALDGTDPSRCRRHSSVSVAQISQLQKDSFLDAFAATGVVLTAAELAGINRRNHYNWLDTDPEYAAAFAERMEDANDVVEAEVYRRGVEGWDEVHIDKKGEAFVTTRYSDNLLIFLAKKRNPAFRDGPRTTLIAAGPQGALVVDGASDEAVERLVGSFAEFAEGRAIEATSREA